MNAGERTEDVSPGEIDCTTKKPALQLRRRAGHNDGLLMETGAGNSRRHTTRVTLHL
jgi:hypothetical protein